jgi:hypothetical protein
MGLGGRRAANLPLDAPMADFCVHGNFLAACDIRLQGAVAGRAPSTSTRLNNAVIAKYKSMVDGVVGLALFLLENGPSLLFWFAILLFPARLVWKRVRRSCAQL